MKKLFLLAALLLLFTHTAYAGWYNSAWQYRKEIIVDATNVDADLTDFPLYVKINDDADLAAAQDNGDDIRFTAADGTTLLKYEEESWSGGGGSNATANYWVKVPRIEADDGAIIYMYYGNADASDAQDAANVWDSNFVMVQHMNDVTTSTILDSTSNDNDGVKLSANNPLETATAKVYRAQNFSSDYITITNDTELNPSYITVSAFIMMDDNTSVVPIMKPFTSYVEPYYQYGFRIKSDSTLFAFVTVGGVRKTLSTTATYDTSTWYYLTETFDGNNLRLYVNSSEVAESPLAASGTINSYATNLTFGRNPMQGTDYWAGIIDEVRISNTARSASWIKFEYYNMSESDQELSWGAEEQWLAGWDKRMRMTIDANDIDANLSDFPILVYLSASSGRNSKDVSCVFDEIGANNKKIAVTKSDGTTECYVEIENWDNSAEQAWLWVKVSGTDSVAADAATDLYLYYDNDHADNTDYVGDNGSVVAQNVWDSNFVAVWHLPDGSTLGALDSTSNDKDGSIVRATAGTGQIDGGGNFDGSGDYINVSIPTVPVTPLLSNTISLWYKCTAESSNIQGIFARMIGTSNPQMQISLSEIGTALGVMSYLSVAHSTVSTSVLLNQWYHVSAVFSAAGSNMTVSLYIDSIFIDSNTGSGNYQYTADTYKIGVQKTSQSRYFNGLIDEVRISNTARSAAWIKASYESERDNLLDFGLEEISGAVTGGLQLQGLKLEGVKVD